MFSKAMSRVGLVRNGYVCVFEREDAQGNAAFQGHMYGVAMQASPYNEADAMAVVQDSPDGINWTIRDSKTIVPGGFITFGVVAEGAKIRMLITSTGAGFVDWTYIVDQLQATPGLLDSGEASGGY